jgi:hypothetical protein
VYAPGPGAQLTDFNPGVRPNGLFWTTVVEDDTVDVDLAAGTATLRADGLRMKDYHDFENAILGNGDPPRQSSVSFTVHWRATGPVEALNSVAQRFRGRFRDAEAKMEWSATSGQLDYRSAPLEESTTEAAQLGEENNGSFYD